MCDTCGCSESDSRITVFGSGVHHHSHPDMPEHFHFHESDLHSHSHSTPRTVKVQTDILQHNQLVAERNRGMFEAKHIFALNLVSSPGSGKTSLLERTISELKNVFDFAVIEGDQQTMNDAEKIAKTGIPVVQVNTGNGCHLDSEMIYNAFKAVSPKENSILMIENVGNLVCPSLFDLGETKRIVIMSVTEGEDKPLKYPTIFRSAQVCIFNKVDLLPHVDFNMEEAQDYAHRVNPNLEFYEISVKSGKGMQSWYNWLKQETNGKI